MPGSCRGGPASSALGGSASSAPGVVDGGRECRITVDSSVLSQLRRGRLELVEARLTQSKPQVGLSSLEPQVGRPQPRAEQRRGGRELQTAARELLEEGPAGGGSSPLLLEAPPPFGGPASSSPGAVADGRRGCGITVYVQRASPAPARDGNGAPALDMAVGILELDVRTKFEKN
jgi:hypothetical protein